MRMLRQNIGKPRRDAENERDKANEFRILPQQRQQAAARAQAGEKTVERGKGGIRIFRSRELIDDDRNKLDEDSPHLLAAQRAIGALLPALHGGSDLARLTKAQFRQPVQRLAPGLAVNKSERQILLLRQEARRAFK